MHVSAVLSSARQDYPWASPTNEPALARVPDQKVLRWRGHWCRQWPAPAAPGCPDERNSRLLGQREEGADPPAAHCR
eukprot:7461199-Alexandrium_andersonii.AAC.2